MADKSKRNNKRTASQQPATEVGACKGITGTEVGTDRPYSPSPDITHPQKRAFLIAYADIGTATHAAQAAGVDRRTIYDWTEADPAFVDAWEEAKEAFAHSLEREAFRRARQGTEEYVLHHGRFLRDPITGDYLKRRTYSDRLLELTLRAKLPDQYRDRTSAELSGPGGSPLAVSRVSAMSDDELDSLLGDLGE